MPSVSCRMARVSFVADAPGTASGASRRFVGVSVKRFGSSDSELCVWVFLGGLLPHDPSSLLFVASIVLLTPE